MKHVSQLHLSADHSLGVIIGCILVLLICNYRHVPTYYRELTVGGFLGMAVGIPLAILKLIIKRL